MKPAVFLDRDGTINVEKDYLYRVEDFEFIPGVPEAIRLLNQAGYLVVVVSNQSGVARGYYTEEDVLVLHRFIEQQLVKHSARVDAWYYCPHHLSGRGSYSLPCKCRKPLPGMLVEAARKLDIDLSASFMVGDKIADVEAGLAAGCRSILVRTGYGAGDESVVPPETEIYDDLFSAAKALTALDNPV